MSARSRLKAFVAQHGKSRAVGLLRTSDTTLRGWLDGAHRIPGSVVLLLDLHVIAGHAHEPTGTDWRALRERMGWRQADLAELLGTTERRVRMWEAGSEKPGSGASWKLACLAAALQAVPPSN